MKKIFLILTALLALSANAEQAKQWLSGDFHQHTYYSDGSTTFNFVMERNMEFGLDWWANSEHGGQVNRNGSNLNWDNPNVYANNPILGDVKMSGGHQVMFRWQSLRDFAWLDILAWRNTLSNLKSSQKIFSGVEWNVPDHEHCSVAIVDGNAAAISAFEYMFDKSDSDTSRNGEVTEYGVLTKQNKNDANTIAACTWMQEQYDAGTIDNAWIIWAHVERAGAWKGFGKGGGYNVENFRNFNNVAPDICFGFEGIPGHQVNPGRGGFGSGAFGGTYGGAGYYIATVGGLWDAMLGEGRHFYNFASSDYHLHWTNGGDDYYPGEYQKTWVCAIDDSNDSDYDLNEIADALRSGNSWTGMGDLIDYLAFSASQDANVVPMGSDMQAKNGEVTLTIKFASPLVNNHGDVPVVDHIDLIGGDITGKIDPASADYTKATNDTTKIIATFTAADWTKDTEGLNVITIKVPANKSMYYRLRGTNIPRNTAFETDAAGNPLADSLATQNLGLDEDAEARADLWFYSNPIFVYVN